MTSLLASTLLLEGITHIEDLPLDEFIRAVETLKDKRVTEKLDGANLWFGIDDDGELFTSREGKTKGARFYATDDYAQTSNTNGFRAAHLALERASKVIKQHLSPGDMVEAEIMFGRQPNTVTYGGGGLNYIVVLRGVNGTEQAKVDKLAKALDGKQAKVESTVITSPDGEELEHNDEKLTWEFTSVKPLNTKTLDTKAALAKLAELKDFLERPSEVKGLSNRELIEVSLSSIDKERRSEVKQAREAITSKVMHEFKLPIKELLLDTFVRKIKSALQAPDLHPDEDIGIEGVVVSDGDNQVKIVDKDVFTAINTFNNAVRSSAAGLVRTDNQDAAIEMRGGAYGQARIRIANLLGVKELALSSGTKRIIRKFMGADAVETAANLGASLNIGNIITTREKIAAILDNAGDEVNDILSTFKQETDKYRLKLKTGKEIGLSPEVVKRTLTAFAEVKREISDIKQAVLKAQTPAQLVAALYGRTIKSLFSGDENVTEKFQMIKAFALQEEGEGGEVGVDTPAGQPGPNNPTTTTAGAIAAVPFKLSGGKVIRRRTRNFTKPKKFLPKVEGLSLLRAVLAEEDKVDALANATDADDKANAQFDLEFKQLRNTIANSETPSTTDITNYLDKAHELNDQVDTITFGLELDDGSVVKVYVNAQEADQFEAKLAELLGQEEDVEQVINLASETFDIVDVVWPDSMTGADEELPAEEPSGEPPVDGEEPAGGADDFSEIEPSDEEPSDEEPSDEEPSDEEPSDEEPVDGEEPSDEEPVDGEEPSDEEPSDEEPVDGEEPSDEDDMTDDFDADTEEPAGKPRKKQPKQEESTMSYGQLFKQRLLAEAKKAEAKERAAKDSKADAGGEEDEDKALSTVKDQMPAEVKKLLTRFPNRGQKAIVMLMHSLGVPAEAIAKRVVDVRNGIANASQLYVTDGQFRLWVKRLMAEMQAEVSAGVAEGVKESAVQQRLNNPYQKLIYAVLKQLGLPESDERAATQLIVSGVKEKAKIAQNSSLVRAYLKMISKILGVELPKELATVTEATLAAPEDEKDGPTWWTDAVMDLMKAMGVNPDVHMRKPIASFYRDIRKTVPTRNRGQIVTLMKRLEGLFGVSESVEPLEEAKRGRPRKDAGQGKANPPEIVDDEDSTVDTAEKEFTKVMRRPKKGEVVAADQGKWIIGKFGSNGMMLKVKGMQVKMEEEEAEKLAAGIGDGKVVSVRATDGTRFIFTPLQRGKMYAAKRAGDVTEFPNGILISNAQLDEILDAISA